MSTDSLLKNRNFVFFLSNLSAITPEGNMNKNIGNTWANPIRPRSSGFPVNI